MTVNLPEMPARIKRLWKDERGYPQDADPAGPRTSTRYVIMPLQPNFDWAKLTWGRPDSVPTVLCSYCSATLDDVALILCTGDGWSVRFCRACGERAIGAG